MREAALSELDSAPRLGVNSVGGSETRSTVETRDCLNAVVHGCYARAAL